MNAGSVATDVLASASITGTECSQRQAQNVRHSPNTAHVTGVTRRCAVTLTVTLKRAILQDMCRLSWVVVSNSGFPSRSANKQGPHRPASSPATAAADAQAARQNAAGDPQPTTRDEPDAARPNDAVTAQGGAAPSTMNCRVAAVVLVRV